MTALTCTDAPHGPIHAVHSGLWFAVSCRHCGGQLEEVNAGHSDGARSMWVGSCVRCRRQWVITADICQVPSRGPYEACR